MTTPKKDKSKANKRTEAQKEIDRVFIADKIVCAVPIKKIHVQLNERNEGKYQLSYSSVYADVKKIMQDWHDERIEFIDNEVDRILKTLEKMQQEAWEAWEKSKELAKTKTKRESIEKKHKGKKKDLNLSEGNIIEYTEETGYGDTKYLDVVQYCIDKRMDLFGLKKIRVDQINRNLNKNMDEIDYDKLSSKEKKILRDIYGLKDEFN